MNKKTFITCGSAAFAVFFLLAISFLTGCERSAQEDITKISIVPVTAVDIPLSEITGAGGTPEGKGQVTRARLIGHDSSEYVSAIQQTADQGFILAGHTRLAENTADDAWVVRLNKDLNILWSKSYSGGRNEYAYSVIQTADGNFVFAGEIGFATIMDDLNMSESYKYDAYIVKLNPDGMILWEKYYGGDDYDCAKSIKQTTDGGYIVAGYAQSYGATYTPEPHAKKDIWIFKLDADGNKQWEFLYGEKEGTDSLYSVVQADDGGYVACGYTESYGKGGSDVIVMKMTPVGTLKWSKTFGGEKIDVARFIDKTQDGGFIISGETWANGETCFDGYIIKIDGDGNLLWEKSFGGGKFERAFEVRETENQEILVAGYTSSQGAGERDFLVIKYDKNGNLIRSNTYGGYSCDMANALTPLSDGSLMVAGPTSSLGNGEIDSLLLKINND